MEQHHYIQVGLSTLRTPDDEVLVDVPLYIRVAEIQPNGLAKVEENLLHTIAEIVAKYNENTLVEKIEKLKGNKKHEKNILPS